MFLIKENNKESFVDQRQPTSTPANPNQTSVSHQILDPRKHMSIVRPTSKINWPKPNFQIHKRLTRRAQLFDSRYRRTAHPRSLVDSIKVRKKGASRNVIYNIMYIHTHTTHSAQISQKQDERNIYVYAIMKTMCPPSCHYNSFVAIHALGHMMYW